MDISPRQKLTEFFDSYKKYQYQKKEILIRPDEDPGSVFYLEQGVVRMYAISANGEELVINIFKPGAFFPMSWVLNNSTPRHYYEAMENVSLRKAPKLEFLEFLTQNPDLVIDLLKRIYLGLEGYFTRMEYLMTGKAASRLITELLIFAKRFGSLANGSTVVSVKLTEKDLAAQAGITRETVSRELQKLKNKGLVKLEKNTLIINDLTKLEAELSV